MTSFRDSLHFGGEGLDLECVFDGEWSQGRTAYGGLVVSKGLELVERIKPEGYRVTHIQVLFIGPVFPGEVTAQIQELRTGRTTASYRVEFFSAGKVATSIQVVCRVSSDSALEILSDRQPEEFLPPSSYESLPYVEGLTPKFTRFLEYRFVGGGLPFTGDPSTRFTGYVRHTTETTDSTLVAAVALFDAWPGPLLNRLEKVAPASSLTWAIDILFEPTALPDDYWLLDVESPYCRQGTGGSDSRLYDASGRLVMIGRQQIAVFDS